MNPWEAYLKNREAQERSQKKENDSAQNSSQKKMNPWEAFLKKHEGDGLLERVAKRNAQNILNQSQSQRKALPSLERKDSAEKM